MSISQLSCVCMLSRNADPKCNAMSGNSSLKVSKMNCKVKIDLFTS